MLNEFFVNSINEFMLVAIITIMVKDVEVIMVDFCDFDVDFTPFFKVIPINLVGNCLPHHQIQEVCILIMWICLLVLEIVLYSFDLLLFSNLMASLIL